MLRVAVLFLVGLPMLMPPGMCLCQFLPCASAHSPTSGSDASGSSLSDPESGPERTCGCKRRQAAPHTETARADTPHAMRSAARGDSTPSAPTDHAPGCPALQSADKSKTVAPSAFAVDGLTARTLDATLVAVPTFRGRLDPLHSTRTPDAPLFLAHCALLI